MLRFIRKFQLLILVVGGSLLMVVFLLQPVLTKLAPSPDKAKVAKLDDGTTYTRGDRYLASSSLTLLEKTYPRILADRSVGGFGVMNTSESNREYHWMMLVKLAKEAGLVGEAGDGASWISVLALREAKILVEREKQQGLIRTTVDEAARIQEVHDRAFQIISSNARSASGMTRSTMNDVYTVLAEARGVERLLTIMGGVLPLDNNMPSTGIPSFSDIRTIQAAHTNRDAIAVNATVLDSSLVVSAIPEPTDEQLQAFFDIYKAQSPADNEFQIGYTQPTRLQLGWLTLDKQTFADTARVSRVELMKIYQKDRVKYPGDFGLEKIALERQYRDELATKMLTEADRTIRGQIISATKGLPKVDGSLTLPADWDTRQPNLETIAAKIVENISSQFEVSLPTPAITIIGDRWLSARDITALPGFGQSIYRIGSTPIPTNTLSQFFENTELRSKIGLDVQVGLPLADPAAVDQGGNRYYAMVIGVREEGPADTITDVTRDVVLSDYKSVEAYNLLVERIEEFKLAISTNGSLEQAIDLAAAFAIDQTTITRPTIYKNIRVNKNEVYEMQLQRPSLLRDPRLAQSEDFRTDVLESAAHINPLASPEAVATSPVSVVTALPAARALGIALVIAPRPLTAEDFGAQSFVIAYREGLKERQEASLDIEFPFSYKALASRYGLTKLKKDADEEAEEAAEAAAAEAETEDSESATETEEG